ncbi:MAG TPA: hypothetical protein VMR33_07250 [Candidatus Baltobacteraceae bacterium]|jgi:hypothetical protein|nr:hypothetical protein [Candidatus Baltobacteraceae bacterium]
MTYEVFFAGVGATLLGTLLGAWLTCRMTFDFQKRLLQQQLDFQRQLADHQIAFMKHQADADAALRQRIYSEWHAVFKEFRNMINTRASQLVGQLESLCPPRESR